MATKQTPGKAPVETQTGPTGPQSELIRTLPQPEKAEKVVDDAVKSVAINWDELPDPEVPTYTRNETPRVDVESSTPDAIKRRVRESFEGYVKGEGMKADTLKWMLQKFPTVAIAEEFVRLAKRYGKYTEPEMTVRVTAAKDDPSGLTIRYAARPRQHRVVNKDNAA